MGLAGASGAIEGLEGLDCTIRSSKWTFGFIDRLDLRSVGSAMIIKLRITLSLMNSKVCGCQEMPRR